MRSVAEPNLTDDPYLAVSSLPAVGLSVGYRLRFALHAAVLAPSVHNTQPWRFRVYDSPEPYADLLIDPARELSALDPQHRQLIISCGAALAAYEIGLRSCGLAPRIELRPLPDDEACLARIHVTDLQAAAVDAGHLLGLLVRRRSYRGAMTGRPVEQPTLDDMRVAAGRSGDQCLLDVVPQDRWRLVEHLVVRAVLELADQPGVDDETRTWTRLGERSRDGVPAANWQRTSEESAGAPVVQRDFAQGRPLPETPAHVSSHSLEGNPVLGALLTPADTPNDWIEAGRALLNVTLAAEAEGLALGYVNQPTEVPGLRGELAELLSTPAGYPVPQLLVRVGYPADPLPPATPRRTVRAVLIDG